MIMAIVADKMGKPLNELRFKSIKEVNGLHMAALLHHHLGDSAVLGGEDLVFHLHGLQHHQQLALLDGGTLGHLYRASCWWCWRP